MTSSPDPRFTSLKRKVHSREGDSPPPPEGVDRRTHAAVSVILRGSAELEILLIKRAIAPGDPWSGQMALPGGRQDPSDPNLFHTALRETEEETRVPLDRVGFPIGRLEPMSPATRRLPPILIFPFVFGVPAHTRATAASREVDEVLWTPISAFRDPGALSTVTISYEDGTNRDFPCFRIDGRVVWGITYRILTGFFGTL